MNPPAKLSPAPVGSKIDSSGYAGALKISSPVNSIAPCSPFFIMSDFGPSN
jgi:hypothetical protein